MTSPNGPRRWAAFFLMLVCLVHWACENPADKVGDIFKQPNGPGNPGGCDPNSPSAPCQPK